MSNMVRKCCLGWDCISNYDHAYNGRLWLLWNRQICNVVELFKSDQLIHAKVSINGTSVTFLLSLVYATNLPRDRVQLWQDISDLASSVKLPWIIAGDFNTTLKYDERLKGGVIEPGDTSELQTITRDYDLQDMRFSGEYYTWCNKHELHDRLYSKLDRSLVNVKWIHEFPSASTFFGLDDVSDHAYGLVTLDVNAPSNSKPFRFCEAWKRHPQFLDLVREARQCEVQGYPMFRLVSKLKVLKGKLKSLHRSNYSNLEGRIEEVKKSLVETQHQILLDCLNAYLQAKERELRQQYMELLATNEVLLRQMAKIEWLQQGDLNTAYFHASIKQKRAQNTISTICTEDGVLLSDESQVKEEIL